MKPLLHRASLADLELRTTATGRTLVGLAVPFDRPTEIRDHEGTYTEMFRRGAFLRTLAQRDASRVKVLAHHRRDTPIGVLRHATEDTRGLVVELAISQTQAGDETLTLVRDRALDGLSVGFRDVRSQWSADRRRCERLEVALLEVSIVTWGAYPDALVTGVRTAAPSRTIAEWRAAFDPAPAETGPSPLLRTTTEWRASLHLPKGTTR